MKRTYVVQLIVDAVIIFLAMCNYMFPSVTMESPNMVFFLMMGTYAGLELCEYIFDNKRKEPLYIFAASATAAFAGIFLRTYEPNFVLSLAIVTWLLMIAIIKIISLEDIYENMTHLFLIKLTSMSILVLIGLLVSINIYYRISTINHMLAFMYLTYGTLEFGCDFLTYLSENVKFLKE